MAYRTYRAMYSFSSKDAADLCMESGDTLIVRPLPNGEWPDQMSKMTGTNTRTNMIIVFPGDLVVLVSESGSESVNEPESNPPPQPSSAGFTSIPSTILSTETEEGPQHILSHQVPKHVDIEECFRLYMHAMEILNEYNGLEAGKGQFFLQMNLVEDVEVLNKLIHQCENQIITIGVVGGYNSGKSTLINGLLKCKYLPEAEKAETALSIPIQHEPSIHYGLCESGAQSCCPQCPKVVINGTEHIGQKKIFSALSKLNENARSVIPTTNSPLDHQKVVLMANIPSLSCPAALKSSCPAALKSGFKVYLVDNPGLGELNQLATRMAELAVATSTAYIYTMDCESIELKEHAEVLKVLLEKDKDLLQSDRLVMVVTKCDRSYKREGALSGSKEQKRIKDLVCKTFHSSLKVPVPCENVIPISGMWQSWITRYGTLDTKTRKNVDLDAEIYMDSMDECEKANEPNDKLAALKHGSNYASLEKKIASLVQKCLDFFKAKMKTTTLSALEWAVAQLNSCEDTLEKERNDRTENLKRMKETFDEMDQIERDVTNALDGGQLSGLKTSLEAAFKIDIEQVKEQLFKDAQELYTQFETVCVQKERNGYIVREFLTDFKGFLIDVNSYVMLKIRKQEYRTMYEFYSNAHKSLVSKFQELNKAASLVCHRDCTNIDLIDESTLCQDRLIKLSYDQISTVCVANQPIHRCNPQDARNALLYLRGLAACFITEGLSGDDAFPSVSPKAVEEEEIFTHRLKSREIASLLNVNRTVVGRELTSFLEAIRSQFVHYFSDKFSEDGQAYLSAWNANWKVHLTTSKKNAETQEKETLELRKSLQKVSELSDYIQSLSQRISMQ